MSPTRRRRRRLWWLLAAVLLLSGALTAYAFVRPEGDVSNPGVDFVETEEEPTQTAPSEPQARGDHPADDGFEWPLYGFTKQRTHALPVRRPLRPPLQTAWAERGSVLLEFTPVLCRRKLYLLKNNAALYAVSRLSGRVAWKRKLGYLAASSPACSHGTVYVTLLERGKGTGAGRVVAVSARTGRTRWSRKLPSRSESSPLLDRGRLYFGTEDGTVYALRARDGAVRWRHRAPGAVKGALALSDGKLFFGDYDGQVHAIRRSDGGKVWSASGSGGGIGGAGNFYSSPAVAYGRVYIGNTDGNVYSFSARDGKLAWRKRTGGFVYASPAVARPPGGRPTVYVGSYDGRFYALDAQSGRTRWSRRLGTKISGAATVVGDLVFPTDLEKRTTWALGVRTGKTQWRSRRGGFNAVISDGRRIYLNGYSSLFGLDPQNVSLDPERARNARRAQAQRAARRERDRARAAAERSRKFRTAPHGHRHSEGPRGCHEHRHVYEVRGERRVLVHHHCHTHLRRGR
jgi:outer membrane protein assembly factor BamB